MTLRPPSTTSRFLSKDFHPEVQVSTSKLVAQPRSFDLEVRRADLEVLSLKFEMHIKVKTSIADLDVRGFVLHALTPRLEIPTCRLRKSRFRHQNSGREVGRTFSNSDFVEQGFDVELRGFRSEISTSRFRPRDSNLSLRDHDFQLRHSNFRGPKFGSAASKSEVVTLAFMKFQTRGCKLRPRSS